MAEAITTFLVDNLAQVAATKIASLLGVTKEMEKLSSEFDAIKNVLEDAETRQIGDESVRGWVQKLKGVAYDLEDLLEEWRICFGDHQQRKAGEGRVHVVVSEEHGWVFVGFYDGFNGPDDPDYLLSHLFQFVHHELKGLLWKDGNFEYQSYGCNYGGEPKKWRSEWERERVELERRLKEQLNRSSSNNEVNHSDVLKAMSEGLRKTQEAYFEVADQMLL